jgi:hypothetical protein
VPPRRSQPEHTGRLFDRAWIPTISASPSRRMFPYTNELCGSTRFKIVFSCTLDRPAEVLSKRLHHRARGQGALLNTGRTAGQSSLAARCTPAISGHPASLPCFHRPPLHAGRWKPGCPARQPSGAGRRRRSKSRDRGARLHLLGRAPTRGAALASPQDRRSGTAGTRANGRLRPTDSAEDPFE